MLDTLSSLKAIFKLQYEHPVVVEILELYMDLTKDGKEIVFVWVPGHVAIRGNSAADAAAKVALVGVTSVELKILRLKITCQQILELWQLSGMSPREINYTKYSQY